MTTVCSQLTLADLGRNDSLPFLPFITLNSTILRKFTRFIRGIWILFEYC